MTLQSEESPPSLKSAYAQKGSASRRKTVKALGRFSVLEDEVLIGDIVPVTFVRMCKESVLPLYYAQLTSLVRRRQVQIAGAGLRQ